MTSAINKQLDDLIPRVVAVDNFVESEFEVFYAQKYGYGHSFSQLLSRVQFYFSSEFLKKIESYFMNTTLY